MEEKIEKGERTLNGIDERLLALIEFVTGKSHKSWKILEENTSIKAEKWRQFYRGTTKASGEMIETVAKKWPDYAYWLACGDTEPERGHIAPPTVLERFPIVKGHPQEWATAERLFKQRLLDAVPRDPGARQEMEKRLRDQAFAQREKFLVPAIPLCYGRIMRALDEDASDEILLLELDDELRKIRQQRWNAEKKIQNTISTQRSNMGEHITAKKLFEFIGITKAVTWALSPARK